MKYSVFCRDVNDYMNGWTYAHLTSVKVEQRYGDKYPRVYVTLEDGSEDVIDPTKWDCKIVAEN